MNIGWIFMIMCAIVFLMVLGNLLGTIGTWNVFKKAGEKGWKSLIPIYNIYVLYKICWNWKACSIVLGLYALNGVLVGTGQTGAVFTTFSAISLLVSSVIIIEKNHRLALSFGHGYGYTFGLIFLNPIFMLLLGADSSPYLRCEYVARREAEENQKVFARGFCFTKIFLFFVLGCLIGTYWEEFLYFFQHHFAWSSREGLLYGPFSPIYGLGLVAYVGILGKKNEQRSAWMTFLVSFFLGGFVEYMTSFVAEKAFGVTFWDYHDLFLNINGRTTIPYMVVWGLGGLLLMKIVYPRVSRGIEKIPYDFAKVAYPIFVVFLVVDMLLTASAFLRMNLRDQGAKPVTAYGEFLDWAYPDSFMEQRFPVMTLDGTRNPS